MKQRLEKQRGRGKRVPQRSSVSALEGSEPLIALKQQFGVVLEDISSKFDLVLEGHAALDKKIDGVHEELRDFKKETQFQFGVIKEVLDDHGRILNEHGRILNEHGRILNEHGRILESHTEMLQSHTEMIGKLATDVEIIKTDVEFIKGGLRKKVDVEEFEALERRVLFLEKHLPLGLKSKN